MALTDQGAVLLWEIVVGQSQDTLKGGRIVVLDDQEQEAGAPIEEFSFVSIDEQDGVKVARLELTATFGSDVANFDWKVRRVVSAEGTVVDETVEDGGRKAAGSEWTAVAELDLVLGA